MQTIVLKIAEAIGLPLQDLHFGVEAFGDAVVLGVTPHGCNFTGPSLQRTAELRQRGDAGLAQLGDLC